MNLLYGMAFGVWTVVIGLIVAIGKLFSVSKVLKELNKYLTNSSAKLSAEHTSLSNEHGTLTKLLSKEHDGISKELVEIKATTVILRDEAIAQKTRSEFLAKQNLDPQKAIDYISAMADKISELTTSNIKLNYKIEQLVAQNLALEQRMKSMQAQTSQTPRKKDCDNEREL